MSIGVHEALKPAMKKAVTDKEFIKVVLFSEYVWKKLQAGDDEFIKKSMLDKNIVTELIPRYKGLSREVLIALFLENINTNEIKTVGEFQHNQMSALVANKFLAIGLELRKYLGKKPASFKKPKAKPNEAATVDNEP